MKGVLKCGLFAVLFAVFSTVLFTGSSASGVSDYDHVVTTVNELRTQDMYVPSNPDNVVTDVTEIDRLILDTDIHPTYWNGISAQEIDNLQTIYDRAINGGFVAYLQESNYQQPTITVIFSEHTKDLYFENGMLKVNASEQSPIYRVTISQYGNYAGATDYENWKDVALVRKIAVSNDTDFTTVAVNYSINIKTSIYQIRGHNVLYPEGYEGEPLPGSSPQPVEHKPNITWSINDKDVIVYSDDAKNTAVLDDYQIYWFISNTTFSTEQPTEPFALSGCTAPDYNNNFTVPIHYDYGVQAYYADEDCNILQEDDEGNRLADNMVVLTIDGSTFDGSTTDHEAIIGEIEENAVLKAIRKFRPNDGGLAGLIYAPIEAVATLPTIVGSCSPINLPLLGEQVSLTCIRPTIQSSPMGPVYNTISVIITGIVTWWVAWKTFGTIKNIQDPQDDRVEVLKL